MTRTVQLAQIRQQHAELERQFDNLPLQSTTADDRQHMAAGIRDLLVASGMHFGFEESVMAAANYPDFEHHRRQHMAIMIELGILLDRSSEAEESVAVLRSLEFVRHWYRQHQANSDGAFLAWEA